jgi:orotate phosphoribosyltransferase
MLFQPEIARKIAEFLLDIQALKFQPEDPFTWASGMRSPIYCDNRLSLSHVEARNYIKASFSELAQSEFDQISSISGVATAGISHGALLADALRLPFSYVRSKPKGHGMQNLIEGQVKADDRILVIEDLVSTGGSSLKAVEALRDSGAQVLGLASIFTYGFDVSVSAFEQAGLKYFSLCDYSTALNVAIERGYIEESQRSLLEDWYKDPEAWSKSI